MNYDNDLGVNQYLQDFYEQLDALRASQLRMLEKLASDQLRPRPSTRVVTPIPLRHRLMTTLTAVYQAAFHRTYRQRPWQHGRADWPPVSADARPTITIIDITVPDAPAPATSDVASPKQVPTQPKLLPAPQQPRLLPAPQEDERC